MRPPGYEPGELPTAPTRDLNYKNILMSKTHCCIASAKVGVFSETTK